MKRIVTILLTIVIAMSMVMFFGYKGAIVSPFKDNNKEFVTIKATKGTFSSVMKDNEDSFKNLVYLKIYNRLNDVAISVVPGTYEIPSDITLPKLLESLENGEYNKSIKKVTIPEGYTIEQIATTLDKNDIIKYDDFIKACNNYKLPDYIEFSTKVRYDLEGYLFPDTYYFKEGSSGEDIIFVMLKRFEEIISQIENEYNINIENDDLKDIIIKASMIEKEVRLKTEKPIVSSVIDNRIKLGMPLQLDATVLYALGEHKSKVTIADTKVKSLYNTYYTKGLPVGAISNPGKDSIVAALMPEKTDYIYYITKDGTNHRFFKDYESFLKFKNN